MKQARSINYKGNCRVMHPQKFLFSVCFQVRIHSLCIMHWQLVPKVKKSEPDTEPGESLLQRFCRPSSLLFTAKCRGKSYLKDLISLQHVFAFMSCYFKHTPRSYLKLGKLCNVLCAVNNCSKFHTSNVESLNVTAPS